MCLCACISALNKTLHPKYIQRVISSLHTLFHVKALTLLCCGFVLQWVEQEVELESHWQQEVIKVRTHLRFMSHVNSGLFVNPKNTKASVI